MMDAMTLFWVYLFVFNLLTAYFEKGLAMVHSVFNKNCKYKTLNCVLNMCFDHFRTKFIIV